MKKLAVLICINLFFYVSCVREKKTAKEAGSNEGTARPDTAEKAKLDSPPWNTEYNEKTQQLELKFHESPEVKVTEKDVVDAINRKYPKIRLQVRGHRNDTVFVKIPNAETLTEQMGSTGSQTYMAEVTFSLTELPGTKAVNFDFEEGEHASPGTYTREDFRYFH